jgi:D-lactate dehydrogenase (cytochrome)
VNASAGNASAENLSAVEASAVNATLPNASAAHASAVDTPTVNDTPGAERSEGQGARIVERLVAIVGREGVRTSLEERQFFSLDFSEERGAVALAVVRPQTVEQVPAIVAAAADLGVAVNTRGGAMSYCKGHMPLRPETIVLDVSGLNRIVELNCFDRYVTVEPGVTWAQLREALRGTGYRVPYLGTLSGRHATIGAGASQNCTGMGRMTLAEHVLGLEVVLGDGRVVKTGSSVTSGTKPFYRYNGPDLTGLFLCDSGAFGIKTRIHLLLEPQPKVSFGCAAFANQHDLAAAQVAIARSGLHTEAFAFDGCFLEDFADRPPPPRDEKRRMVRRFLDDNPDKLRAWRALLRAWHPSGLGYLRGRATVMYYTAEGFDQATADRMQRELARIVRRFGGKALPTTVPFGLRYGPFMDVGDVMANRAGEVNFPINAKFPVSQAADVVRAFEAFVAENKPLLDRHGIRIACNQLLTGHFWGLEPVVFWRRPLSEFRRHFATEEVRQRSRDIEEDAARTAAAIDLRYRMTRMFRSMGSLHLQWAKTYPFAEALAGETAWELLVALKDVVDPRHIVNPGLLGLGLQ